MAKVLIQPAAYNAMGKAAGRVFEMFPVEIEGKRVLIKPNVLRAAGPDEGITTHPSLLTAVVERVEAMRPASITVGDNPGLFNYGANEDAFKSTGLMEAARGYYRNIGNDSEKVPFNPDFIPAVSLSRAVLESDVIISLPKFKTHGLTVITGCIKNSYGFLPGAQKAALHRAAGDSKNFQEMLVEIYSIRVPDLFIVDAVVGMEGNGPASPDLREIGLVLASDNGVSLDAVIAYMMGCDPGQLPFLLKAREMGLGEFDISKIDLKGQLKRIDNFKLPPFGGEAILSNESIQTFIHNRSIVRPKADAELCTRCGTCVDQCPVSALGMEDGGVPVVDAGCCIVCFCCQEICPEKAITLK